MASLTKETANSFSGRIPQDFKKGLQNAESEIGKFASDFGSKVGATTSSWMKSSTDYMKKGQEYVTENPTKSLLMGVAAGAVAGSLLTVIMRGKAQ